MGRTDGGGARPDQGNADTSGWVSYFSHWMDERQLSNAALARTTGLNDSAISKWRRGAAAPDVASCRRIAQAIHRPLLEVLVAAGHLSSEEAKLKAPPPTPQRPVSEEAARLARLQKVLDDPATPEKVKERLRALLGVAEDMAEETARDAKESRRHSA